MNTRKEIVKMQAISFVLLIALAAGLVAIAAYKTASGFDVSLDPSEREPSADDTVRPISDNSGESIIEVILEADKKYDIDRGFIDYCAENKTISPAGNLLAMCLRYIDARGYRDSMWEDVTGYTFSVLYDMYTGRAEAPDVTVLGDVWSPHKTTLAISGAVDTDHASPDLISQLGEADIFVAGAPGAHDIPGVETVFPAEGDASAVRYYISGGTKTAVCRAEDADDLGTVADANANSDLVVVITSSVSEDFIRSLADYGAGVVASAADGVPLSVGYCGGCAVVMGLNTNLSGTDMRDAAFITVTATVGLQPTVRLYPCVNDGGTVLLADTADRERIVSDINSRSSTAFVADDNRVREGSGA